MDKLIYDANKATISDAVFELPFRKSKEDLADLTEFVKFVKAAESLCKKHPDYEVIISTVKEVQPHCQILGNLTVDDVDIEVHHNCLTHFDICAIITNALLKRGETVTTFEVARRDLLEHKLEHVQLVCLSCSAHESVNTGEVFINLNQGIGNLRAFIEKYRTDEKRQVSIFGVLKVMLPVILCTLITWMLILCLWYLINFPIGISTYATI